MRRRARATAVLAVLATIPAVALSGCDAGSVDRRQAGPTGWAHRPVPVFGPAPAYRPRPAGKLVSGRRAVGGLHCARARRDTFGVHLELFANRRDVVIPAGIGVAPPRATDGAYVRGGKCWYPVRTLEPTGLIEVEHGVEATLGDFFDLWGQPLSSERAASFRARDGEAVSAFVNAKRWRGDVRSIPLRRHDAIVVEIGGYFPPTEVYRFPEGL